MSNCCIMMEGEFAVPTEITEIDNEQKKLNELVKNMQKTIKENKEKRKILMEEHIKKKKSWKARIQYQKKKLSEKCLQKENEELKKTLEELKQTGT